MKKSLASVICMSAMVSSLTLVGCGDDSSTSSNVERAENSSSSQESSSSVEESSSSEALDLPEGTRAATLDDLSKNIALGKMFGSEVFLATGIKKGVFSIWIPDTAWIAVHSEFKNGRLDVNASNGSFMGISAAVSDSLEAFFEKGASFQFVVDDKDKLQYSINEGEYVAASMANVKIPNNTLSDGSKLNGVRLNCTFGDSTINYSFYEGRYLVQESNGKDSSWSAGYFDIQRSRLLQLPVFFSGSINAMTTATLSDDMSKLNMATDEARDFSCTKKEFKYGSIARDSLVGSWSAGDHDLDWTLDLKSDGSYSVIGKNNSGAADYNKSGIWDVYGDLLLIRSTACKDPGSCTTASWGVVSGFDPEKGFTVDHNDPDEPLMPKTWTLPQYE